MARFEGADYLLDLEESSVPSRKILWNVALNDAGNGSVDANYTSLLEDLHNYWDAKFGEEEEEEKKEDGDDPTYRGFSRKLKVHGNAYMRDVSEENGVYHPIIYEEEDTSIGTVMRTTSEEDNSIGKVKRRTARMSIGNRSRDKRYILQGDDMKLVRNNSVAENVSCDELKRRSFDGVSDQKSRVKKSDLRNDHHDGMKERRRTPMSSRDDYVKENRRLDLDADQRSGPKYPDFGKKICEVDKDFDFFIKNLHVKGEHAYFEYGDKKRVYYENWDKQTTDVIDESLETDTRPLASIKTPLIPIPRTPTSPLIAQITKSKKRTPRDAQNMLITSNKKHNNEEEVSMYWRELHDDLRRPYNQKEFNDLYAFMSVRKPVLIYKESRSGGYYNPGPLGKSYLDLYPDLNREIEKVKSDSHRVLNLLRMFKIYVQKIPVLRGSDQIKPWMHDFSKAILPGSSDDC